jgi:hypothetical protein
VKHLIRNLDAEESARELEAAAAGMRVLIWCNSMSSASLTRDAAKKQGKLEYQVAAADGWNAETEAVLCAFLKRQIAFACNFTNQPQQTLLAARIGTECVVTSSRSCTSFGVWMRRRQKTRDLKVVEAKFVQAAIQDTTQSGRSWVHRKLKTIRCDS